MPMSLPTFALDLSYLNSNNASFSLGLCQVQNITQDQLSRVAALESDASEFPWKLSNFESSFNLDHICVSLHYKEDIIAHTVISRVLDEAEILIFTVSKRVQGRGVGGAFLNFLHETVLHEAANIFLEVRESNNAAIALYRRSGYTDVGIRNNYYKATEKKPSENAIIFVREQIRSAS